MPHMRTKELRKMSAIANPVQTGAKQSMRAGKGRRFGQV